jgi:hypothetical protein
MRFTRALIASSRSSADGKIERVMPRHTEAPRGLLVPQANTQERGIVSLQEGTGK